MSPTQTTSFCGCHLAPAAHALGAKLVVLLGGAMDVFVQPGSQFSLWSLSCAFLIALAVLSLRQRTRGRRVRLRTLLKILFPRWLVRSPSTRADLGFFLLNTFATGALIGWALISFGAVQHISEVAVAGAFGSIHRHVLGPVQAEIVQTVAMFLAYEFAYWLDHYLSHEIPVLWEFHRVHHTAEALSPLTVFRVHPVDVLVFYNIAVLVMGITSGGLGSLLGEPGHGFTIGGSNVIALGCIFVLGHLQHSHMWIAFTGLWGRLVLSPAHHQIHHSTDPRHFGKNLGSSLAVWDWMFGTLAVPARERQALVFGVEPGRLSPHTVTGGLVTPFARCAALLREKRKQAVLF